MPIEVCSMTPPPPPRPRPPTPRRPPNPPTTHPLPRASVLPAGARAAVPPGVCEGRRVPAGGGRAAGGAGRAAGGARATWHHGAAHLPGLPGAAGRTHQRHSHNGGPLQGLQLVCGCWWQRAGAGASMPGLLLWRGRSRRGWGSRERRARSLAACVVTRLRQLDPRPHGWAFPAVRPSPPPPHPRSPVAGVQPPLPQ